MRRDEAEAVAWYRKAAAQKLPLAQLLLGVAYATGRGVPRDDPQAFSWFEQAANSGLPLAQYGLGMMYNEGRGVGRDGVKAYLWLDLAVSTGYVGAARPLDSIARQLNEADLTRAKQLASDWRQANARLFQRN